MYGMVNRSIEEMVLAAGGEAVWEEVKRRAQVEEEVFISNSGYPDEITYRLVGAASDVLQTPVNDILHAFGEHWVLNTAQKGYGPMMALGGSSLPEFLSNLPAFHDRVALLFPKLVPPRFQVTDRTPDSLRLHYFTEREGLTPFVGGLISGLGKLFNTPVKYALQEARATGHHHDVFLVQW